MYIYTQAHTYIHASKAGSGHYQYSEFWALIITPALAQPLLISSIAIAYASVSMPAPPCMYVCMYMQRAHASVFIHAPPLYICVYACMHVYAAFVHGRTALYVCMQASMHACMYLQRKLMCM